MKKLGVLVVLATSLALAIPASAEPSAAEIAVARDLFRQVQKHELAKEWSECVGKLEQALAIKDTPGLRYHLAFCQEQRGNLVEAMVEYDRAEELIAKGMPADDVTEMLVLAREKLRSRMPTLVVVVPKALTSARLSIDGTEVASVAIGQPIPLNPKEVSVVVRVDGYEPFEMTVTLAEGEQRTIQAELVRTGDARAPSAQTPTKPAAAEVDAKTATSGWPARTWVLFGESAVAVAGIAVGVVYTLNVSDAEDRLVGADRAIDRAAPGDTSACARPGGPAADACAARRVIDGDRDQAQTLATIGFVGAGVGVAATVGTFLLWKAPPKDQAAFLIAPTKHGGAVVLSGRF